jgi:hypothetical protein
MVCRVECLYLLKQLLKMLNIFVRSSCTQQSFAIYLLDLACCTKHSQQRPLSPIEPARCQSQGIRIKKSRPSHKQLVGILEYICVQDQRVYWFYDYPSQPQIMVLHYVHITNIVSKISSNIKRYLEWVWNNEKSDGSKRGTMIKIWKWCNIVGCLHNSDIITLVSSSYIVRGVRTQLLTISLLEKWFIVTPWIHYWCRLKTVADINNGELTTRY